MIEIHGVPYDLGGARQGSRLGPAALRLAGLIPAIEGTGRRVFDQGDLPVSLSDPTGTGLAYSQSITDVVDRLKNRVLASLQAGHTPLMLGGEHSTSIGPISACLQHTQGDLAVIWIDAHADINTPGTSETGNIHGMPLAVLSNLDARAELNTRRSARWHGEATSDWQRLKDVVGDHWLKPHNIAWLGLRDVDQGEVGPALHGLPLTMHEIDRFGVLACWEKIHQWLLGTGCKNLYVSFDVDALDPFLAPGTGTAVRGGITYREAHLLAELISETLETDPGYQLLALDVVETSPVHDSNNQTATVAVEWVASLFGKTVLGGIRGGRE